MNDSGAVYYTRFNCARPEGWDEDERVRAMQAVAELAGKYSMVHVGDNGWAFVSDHSANETVADFRAAVGAVSGKPIGFAWLTPMALFVDHRWLEGDLADRFYAARSSYEDHCDSADQNQHIDS